MFVVVVVVVVVAVAVVVDAFTMSIIFGCIRDLLVFPIGTEVISC